MSEIFRNRAPMGGQAFPMGVLMRGRRNAAAFRTADGEIMVKTWQAKTKKLNSGVRKIPMVRGAAAVGTAIAEGARTAAETVKIAKAADKKGNPLIKLLMYHGAEHKTIHCYEKGLDMTVDNVKSQSRIHPRCGTAIAVTALLTNAALSAALPKSVSGSKREAAETALMLLSIGLGYEVNRYGWKHDGKLIKAVTAPGLWAQNVTTAEPDDDMIECAIAASRAANEA